MFLLAVDMFVKGRWFLMCVLAFQTGVVMRTADLAMGILALALSAVLALMLTIEQFIRLTTQNDRYQIKS